MTPARCPICNVEPKPVMLRAESHRFGCYLDKPFPHSVVVYAPTADEARARYVLAFGEKP